MFIKCKYITDQELTQRAYSFMFMLYPDSTEYDCNTVLNCILQADYWAYILHDKEEGVKPHYHIAVKFNNQRKLSGIINDWGLWNYNPNNERIVISSWKGALNYLIHNTKDSINKYQYSEDEVESNIPEIIDNLRNHKDYDDIFLEICDYIVNGYHINYYAVLDYCRKKDDKYIKVLLNKRYSYYISNLIKERGGY